MYIWDVRRKINPLLLGFRNVFIKKILNHDIIDPVLKMAAPSECLKNIVLSPILELRADYVVYLIKMPP